MYEKKKKKKYFNNKLKLKQLQSKNKTKRII